MTLDTINQMVADIQDMASSDEGKAVVLRDDLFSLLLKRDEFYIVSPNKDVSPELLKKKSFRPFISSAAEGDPHLFLRIFTEEQLASKLGIAVKITSLELTQLIKFWFLRGVYGVLLNDGATWVVIPIPVLSNLFCEIAQLEKSDPDYVAVVELANDIRINSYSHITSYDTGDVITFTHEQGSPATLKTLFNADKPIITPSGRKVEMETVLSIMEEIGGGDDVLR